MDKLVIEGGARLSGAIPVSGAKNAALPILCASLLTPEPLRLTNVPQLNDVRTMRTLLRQMGVAQDGSGGTLTLQAERIDWPLAPYELVKTMRASILALGPLVARCGEARVSLPGGCAIGLRPVDQHVKGLQAMGAEISLEHGYIEARAAQLAGVRFGFDLVTVTGTENLMMAATLAKGRTILEKTLPLLARAGIVPSENPETSRKLIIGTNEHDVSIVILRAQDVPTYVQHGAADLGVAGKDVLLEHGGDGLYQPLDLRIGRCRLVVATRRGFDWAGTVQRGARIRVASKYVDTAREHFAAKGMHVDLIKLYGSMELAPLVGLADAIVDLVSTGNTLKANDLVAVEEVLSVSARLIVNPASLKLKRDRVKPLIDAIASAVAAEPAVA